MDHYYGNELEKLSPNYAKKHWVKNMTRGNCGFMTFPVSPCHYHSYISFHLLKIDTGAHAEWMTHVDKLILEILPNCTPPNCIQANIYAMSCWLLPNDDVVIELPILKHIKNLRTFLCLVKKSIDVCSFAKAKDWKQMLNDKTAHHHASLTNVVMTILTKEDEFKTICVSGLITAEDGTVDK